MPATPQEIKKWYDFALAQMAAESYLDGVNLSSPEVVGPSCLHRAILNACTGKIDA